MTQDHDIWLGDLVRAIRALRPREEVSNAAIARSLGFSWRGRRTAVQPAYGKSERKPVAEPKRKSLENQLPPKPKPVEKTTAPSVEKSKSLPDLLTPLDETESAQNKGLVRPWELQKPLGKVTERHLAPDPPYEPLLERRWTPGILAAVSATQSAIGAVDTRRVVEIVASGRPLDRIPMLPSRSLASGVQLLIDHGIAMEPFRRDQYELAEALRAVVGQSRVEELIFHDCPARGCFDADRWKAEFYRPPAPGTPVLVLSDLGLGGPRLHPERASIVEWLDLAAKLRRRDCHLVALVPYPKDRWYARLRKVIVHIPWDRTTSIRRVLELTR